MGVKSKKNTGKTLTVFLVVIAVLLISLTIIAVFFFLEEVKLRESAEYNLEQMRLIETRMQVDLKEAKKQAFLLDEKSKESDEKIESLLEDIDIEQGLREEIKKETRELREKLEQETQTREELRLQLRKDISDAQGRVDTLQQELDGAITRNKELEASRQELEDQNQRMRKELEQLGIAPSTFLGEEWKAPGDENVDLETIVVATPSDNEGRVISVDKEANFVIVSLGESSGIKTGTVLSVHRNGKHLGDIEVTRVLPEMSAADFLPPLSSRKVRKDDQVMIKK